ncbi:MAG: T9SS type A sorting domain-containing protein [Flavobacteriales bacterium]
MKKALLVFFASVLVGSAPLKSQGFTYTVTYTNYPAQAQVAFDYACELWSYLLYSPIQIKINTYYYTYPGGPLGITFSNGRRDFTGAIMDSTNYPTSLGNFLSGTELNPGEYDMDIYVNGAYSWYYGTDGNTPAGQYDFATVIMHEIGHALGFTSLLKKTGASGSMGMLLQSDFAPVNPSFPWPDQDSLPGIYDRFIENTAGAKLDTFANPSNALGAQLTSNQLYFNGPLAVAANAGIRPRLHAPGVFELGTCILHLNESTYPNGNPEELMTPYVTTGYDHHLPGPVTLAMLQDMGWTLHTGISGNEKDKTIFRVYPVPANDYLQVMSNLALPEDIRVSVFAIDGKTVIPEFTTRCGTIVSTSGISAGVYFVEIVHENKTYRIRFIKS